jgi:hypothetical protein
MDAFPTIENILDQTHFSTFHEEIEKMPEKKRIKLYNEEYKALGDFRMKLLVFYEENNKAIREYTQEVPTLEKQVYQMLKEFKEKIVGIRTKHLKTDVPDEPLGVFIKPLRTRRFPQGSTLQERFIAGDDFIRDVQKLPKKYQEKIESEIQKLNEQRDQEIQDAKEKRNLQRDKFWATLDKIGREYEQKKEAIKEFDQYEESDIKTILGKHEVRIVRIRQKYIELAKLPNVDINSPEADNYENDENHENKNDVKDIKNQVGAKEMEIDVDSLYTQSIIQEKIKIPFNKLSNNMTRFFENYAEKKIERKCRNEGYIRMGTSTVLSYSTGLLTSDSIIYNVVYSVDVCFPYENMEIDCKIKNITKIGIRAIISEQNNPIILFISREHNPDKDFDQYKENQIIKVKVLGHRFELNDEYISVIGELIN